MLLATALLLALSAASHVLPAPPTANRQTETLAGVAQFGNLISPFRLAGLQASLKSLPVVDFLPGSAAVASAFAKSRNGAAPSDNSSLVDAEKVAIQVSADWIPLTPLRSSASVPS